MVDANAEAAAGAELAVAVGERRNENAAAGAIAEDAAAAGAPQAADSPGSASSAASSSASVGSGAASASGAATSASSGATARARAAAIPATAAADDGVMIAMAAARLAVKNRILIDILGQGKEFSRERYRHSAMHTILDLADESDGEVEYLERMIKRARGLGMKASGMHDYRRGDVENLKHRRDNAQHLATALRAWAQNGSVLDELVDVAQASAWREVARNIEFNLESEFAPIPEGVDEPGARADRMAQVMKFDLPRLERDRKRAARAEAAHPAHPGHTGAAAPQRRSWLARLRRR